jgi:hypothetical protein
MLIRFIGIWILFVLAAAVIAGALVAGLDGAASGTTAKVTPWAETDAASRADATASATGSSRAGGGDIDVPVWDGAVSGSPRSSEVPEPLSRYPDVTRTEALIPDTWSPRERRAVRRCAAKGDTDGHTRCW